MRTSRCPRALVGLALALSLPACEGSLPADGSAPDDPSLGEATSSLTAVERMLDAQAQYKIARVVEMFRVREWLGLPDYELLDPDHLVGALSNMRGNSISYASAPWSLGLPQLHAGAELGKVYVAFNAGQGAMAGFYSIRVRGAANGHVAEWIDELTQQVVHVGPAAVSAAPAASAGVAAWGVITLRLRNDLVWVYDYHWLLDDIVYGVELAIPEAQLVPMAQVYLPPDLGIVSVTRSFRAEAGKVLLEVAAQHKLPVRSDFVHADRGASLTVHTAFKTMPSLQALAAGANVAFGIERGTSADPQSTERGNSIVPSFEPPAEPPFVGFYRLVVAGDTARWLDLEGIERGTSVGVTQVGPPSALGTRAGATLGVLEDRLSIGWNASGVGITVDAPLPP